jgi:AmmeMemoRadiSam system protein B
MPTAAESGRLEALAAYRSQPVRPPACAGGVYPAEPRELARALDRWLELPAARPAPLASGAPPRLVVAPHVDFARGAAVYARAARALTASDADLFVILGTAHVTPPRLFTLTRLDFATPLGAVLTDRPLVERLAREVGEDEVLGDEHVHADEHSVELPLLAVVRAVRRPFQVLPVLCSSISHLPDPTAETGRFVGALRAAVHGRKVCFVAGADLAHVGPLYGDRAPASTGERAELAAMDRRTLARLEAGDAAGFHREATRDDTWRKLCGVAPIYAAMAASGAGATVLGYAQWTDGVDLVSFAAAAG